MHVSNKLHELEQKHEFANAQFLKHFTQVSELLEPTAKDAQAKVKPADKMLMLLPLFNGVKVKTCHQSKDADSKFYLGKRCHHKFCLGKRCQRQPSTNRIYNHMQPYVYEKD